VCMAHAGAGGNPLGLVAAVVVTGLVGALIALPTLRLSGIYLALATAAFAVIMDSWLFQFPSFKVGGHTFDLFEGGSLTVPRPKILGIDFSGQKADLELLAIGFVICAWIVIAVRRSNFGNRLLAMKDSPAACATLGMSITRTKLAVFTLSAAMAGFGGALYGGSLQVAAAGQFDFSTGLPILLLMVIAGIGTVGAGLSVGIAYGSGLLTNLFPHILELGPVLFGTAGIGMARNPNGFILEIKSRWEPLWERPLAAAGVFAALFAVWLARIANLMTNWPYAWASIAILALAPGLGLIHRPGRAATTPGSAPPPVPLEWVGIDRPYGPDDVAAMDRALGLRDVEPRVPA
jgi:branched-chain amino acid transport system permease protein